MKVLAICGSPRKKDTELLLNKALENIDKTNKELILLRDKEIKHCDGCVVCEKTGECHIKDDMEDILKKLVKADSILIGSPTYFDNITGLLKDFIDRTLPLYSGLKLKGKKCGIIATGDTTDLNSIKGAENVLKAFFETMKMNFVGSVIANNKKIHDKETIDKLKEIGKKLAE